MRDAQAGGTVECVGPALASVLFSDAIWCRLGGLCCFMNSLLDGAQQQQTLLLPVLERSQLRKAVLRDFEVIASEVPRELPKAG